MRAVVVERPNELAVREVETPVPAHGEVLVRSRRAGICRTDIDVATGLLDDPRWVRYPVVLGHEWSGEVAETGPGVDDVAPGDRVVCEGIIPCNRCGRCRRGATHLCENYDQLGFTRGGGYGEYVTAPRHVVHRLPDGVSFETAVLVEPATVVLRGLERGRPHPGAAVGVVGIGTLGSLALRLAALWSPRVLVALGIREEELELARGLGAEAALDAASGDVEEAVRDLTGGGLDLVVETAGAPEALELATRLVREGGRVVALGIGGHGRVLQVPMDRFALRDVELVGSVAYTPAQWERVLDLLAARRLDLDPIVTHRFPVERVEDAFALMDRREGTVAKVVLEHAE